ncbi:hypothetical protein E2C01_085187 [Portunus trituberculatus]|uniref:Uncharacterized protein n=1 Tax=Portunus trituberculatus TaxID=210409 RepID=A0A5B7J6X7_PORTR|nr:hypothetical protein [Portunus trituberculatus]
MTRMWRNLLPCHPCSGSVASSMTAA